MFKSMLKIQLQALLKSSLFFRPGKSKGIKKGILVGLLAVYVGLSLITSFSIMFYQLAAGLLAVDMGWVYFSNVGLMFFSMSVIFSVFISQSMLFEAKDNELLLSMPIKPVYILGSRMLALSVISYVLAVIILVPAGVIYAYIAKPGVVYYILFLLTAIILPLLNMTFACLFGFIVSAISGRLRNKSLFITLISLILIGLYVWGYTTITANVNQVVANGAAIGDTIQKLLPPFYYYGMALETSNFTMFLGFIVWCFVPFGLVYYLLSKYFIRLVTTKRQAKKIQYKEKRLESQGAFIALFKKEAAKFVSSPAYMLNCGLAFLINIGLGVFLIIKGTDVLDMLFPGISIGSASFQAVTLILCFLPCTGITTSPSISLESKNLWILKSCPVNVAAIFNAKIGFCLSLGISTLLFLDACVIFVLRPGFVDALIIIFLPILIQIFAALIGLVFNLQFPKFDYTNEAIVIKQSASVFFSLIVSMAVVTTLALVYVLLITNSLLSFYSYSLIAIIILILTNMALYAYLMKWGISKFNSF